MANVLKIVKATFRDFSDDRCPQMAAALSYYTVFALPPLLLLIMWLVGLLVDRQAAQDTLVQQMQGLLGAEGARAIGTMIEHANRPGSGVMAIVGIVGLVLGATGAFTQLQTALNAAWEVKPDPRAGGIKAFIGKRLISFGFVLVIAFLLLVSFVVSAGISAASDMLRAYLGGAGAVAVRAIQVVVGLAVTWLLFALIFKVLPDARITWRDVRLGAFVTALLFTIGRFLIGFYLGRSTSLSAFGAAAAFALVLVWIYYAAMILLLGAEFTQVWVRRQGRAIEPEAGAIKVAGVTGRSGEPEKRRAG